MEFYPPLNVDQIFDKTINDLAISKFGFKISKNLTKSKSYQNVDFKNYEIGISKSKSFSEKSQIRVIRKLGINERIFHGLSDSSRSYIYRTVIITSQIDLFENLEIIYKSINEWKKMHPLLRCQIFSDDYSKYFAFASEDKIKSKENLKFFYYISNNFKTCDDVWKLLVERETTIPLNYENGLLWRLTFFHVKTVQISSTNLFFYSVILTFDHSIMDGRSSYTSLLQLFSIIENNYLKINNLIVEKPFLPSKEEIFKPKLLDSIKHDSKVYVKSPHFLKMEPYSCYIRLKNLSLEEEQSGMIYDHEGNPEISIKQLVEISKTNNSKFRTLVIQKQDFDIIVAKCKENKVKVTMFFNMCLVQALRLIYEKFDDEFLFLTQEPVIHFTTNISLREFPEYLMYEPDRNSSIGCYIGLAFSTFDKCLNYGTKKWAKNFWCLCHQESVNFHEKLRNKEFIHSIHLPNKKKELDEFFYHFGNSNLGILESSISDKKLIRIKQTFATGRYSKENFLCWLSNLMATIEGQLCWSISYNTCFIRQEIINLLIENLTKIIKELIK